MNAPTETPSFEQATLENCQAMILCLDNRRFVVVHPSEPKNLWPLAGGWDRVRQLKPGDCVIYKGRSVRVRAVEVYR